MVKSQETLSAEQIRMGAEIKRLRELKGLDIASIAAALNVTNDSIQKLQNGTGTTNFIRLARLCLILGTTPNELLGFSAAGFSEETLLGVLEASYMSLGLTDAEAKVLAETVLEVAKQPPLRSVELPPRQAGRVAAELLLRQGARPRKR